MDEEELCESCGSVEGTGEGCPECDNLVIFGFATIWGVVAESDDATTAEEEGGQG